MGLFSALTTDKVKVKKIGEEGCIVRLSVEVPAAEAQDQVHTALARLQQRAKIPGFRPGKAPMEVVKKHFSGHAREEALDAVIRKHVPPAIEELKLRVVETPSIEDLDWAEGKPVSLKVRVEVAPVATAKDYLKIPVTRPAVAADAAAVTKRLDELREAHSRLEKSDAEIVGDGHFAVIDYSATRDGKPLAGAKGESELVDMSAEQSVEGLTAGLKGMKREESKTIKVKLGGKDADLSVVLKEIKTKVLPVADAEFAKDLGFESLDQLTAKLKEVLETEGKSKAEAEVVRQIEEALVAANKFPLPPSMVERQLEGMVDRLRRQLFGSANLNEKAMADLKAKLQPKAEDEVRLAFVLNAIAEKEKIAVAEADLAAELETSLKEAESDERRREIEGVFAERKEQISHMLRERKTMAFLKEKAAYKA